MSIDKQWKKLYTCSYRKLIKEIGKKLNIGQKVKPIYGSWIALKSTQL